MGKGQKNDPKWQKKLYLVWLWSLVGTHVQNDDISRNFFHFFKILIFSVFQSSAINAKRKFWGMSYLLYMCVIFILLIALKVYVLLMFDVSVNSNINGPSINVFDKSLNFSFYNSSRLFYEKYQKINLLAPKGSSTSFNMNISSFFIFLMFLVFRERGKMFLASKLFLLVFLLLNYSYS